MQNFAKISARKGHSIEFILSEYVLVLNVYTFFIVDFGVMHVLRIIYLGCKDLDVSRIAAKIYKNL